MRHWRRGKFERKLSSQAAGFDTAASPSLPADNHEPVAAATAELVAAERSELQEMQERLDKMRNAVKPSQRASASKTRKSSTNFAPISASLSPPVSKEERERAEQKALERAKLSGLGGGIRLDYSKHGGVKK